MRDASAAVSSTVSSATEPIRKTEAYKVLAETVLEALDDSGSAKHAGYEEKEARRLRRQKRLAKAGKTAIGKKRVTENPEYVPFLFRSAATPGLTAEWQSWRGTCAPQGRRKDGEVGHTQGDEPDFTQSRESPKGVRRVGAPGGFHYTWGDRHGWVVLIRRDGTGSSHQIA